jgi:hypothetical protein
MVVRKKFDGQALIDEQVNAIDEAIEQVERRMKPYEKLAAQKQQLLAARRALLGTGSRLTGSNNRLTLDDIISWVTANAGSPPAQIAEHFGVAQSTISSHLYRNKDRFINKGGRYWVRNPGEGLDTAEDIEEDED